MHSKRRSTRSMTNPCTFVIAVQILEPVRLLGHLNPPVFESISFRFWFVACQFTACLYSSLLSSVLDQRTTTHAKTSVVCIGTSALSGVHSIRLDYFSQYCVACPFLLPCSIAVDVLRFCWIGMQSVAMLSLLDRF